MENIRLKFNLLLIYMNKYNKIDVVIQIGSEKSWKKE